MKRVRLILMITVLLLLVTNIHAQEKRDIKLHYKDGNTFTVALSEIDSITFALSEEEEGIVINGVRWATCNVNMPGTFAAKPEDAGMFYQWNRKIGWSSTDPMINSNGGTTWDSSIPTGDSWEKANDPCPMGWRVPTLAEQQSLIAAGSEWTLLNGVNGRYFGSGEQRVFLPAAGYRYDSDGTLSYVGSYGDYWSSTPYPGSSEDAYGMYFRSEVASTSYYWRSLGFSVRCVSE